MSPAESGASPSPRAPRPDTWPAEPRGPVVTVEDEHATGPSTPRSPGRRPPNEPHRKPLPMRLIAAVIIAMMALAGILLLGASQFRSPDPIDQPAPETLSRPAPPGWADEYAWSANVRATTTSLAVGMNHVALIDDQGALHLRHADTGAVLFVTEPNTLSTSAQPFISSAQGTAVAGIIDGANLLIWPLTAQGQPEARQITLGLNARLYQQGGGLMVSTGQQQWIVTPNGQLSAVTIPQDHVGLGVTPEGDLYSAPARGSWTVTAGPAPATVREIRPQATPNGTVGEMHVAWFSRGIIAAWGETADPAQRTAGLYDATTGRLLASGLLSTPAVQGGLPLTVSADGEFAAAGPMLARLTDGAVTVVDGWTTTMSGSRNLYGLRDGAKWVWNGGEPSELGDDTVIPWGTSSRGYAIVLDPGSGSQVRVAALMPR